MDHYVIVDGQLLRSSPAAKRWMRRAAQVVPTANPELPQEPEVDLTDHRMVWEIIDSLEET